MLSRFSISTVAIASLLTLSHAAIASAEIYKTSKNQVVVTGLTVNKKYPVKVTNTKSKEYSLKEKLADNCGEIVVDNASKYKSLVVGTETIDPATLTVKERAKCTAKRAGTITPKKAAKKATKKAPAATTGTMTSPTTTTPATGTTGTMTTPTTNSSPAPATGTTTTPSTAPATTK